MMKFKLKDANPKNTPYDYRATEGVLRLFLVHTPAYHPDYEVSLAENQNETKK